MSITCILPVFNGERFLAEAIRSVLDQEYPDLEIIVVDDGSTDGTREVLARFGDGIRLLRQEHAGVAAARNLGLAEARAEYLAFQDADDLWMPGKLEIQEKCFREQPDLEMCVGLIQNFWMDEVLEEETGYGGSRFSAPIPGFSLVCLLARKALFDRVGPFDTSLRVGSDNDWFLRARDLGAIDHTVPDLLARRRLHAGNLTREDLSSRETLLRNLKASLDRRRTSKDA